MEFMNVPCSSTFFCIGSHLKLDSIHTVDAVEEENQDENEGDLEAKQRVLAHI